MLKPGVSRQSEPGSEQTKQALAKLRKTGRVADAANAFERFL
jgi:hypothetical protein